MYINSDNRARLDRFFGELDVFRYPQKMVAHLTHASEVSLNAWRNRGQVAADTWARNGRVEYTGRGLLQAGIIEELAWLMGPSEASSIAWDLGPDMERCGADGDSELLEKSLIARKPVGASEYDMPKRHNISGEVESLEELMGKPWSLVDEELAISRGLNHATVILPIGHLVAIWADSARRRIE